MTQSPQQQQPEIKMQPVGGQVDQAIADLTKGAKAIAEVVRELLSRIQPLQSTPAVITGALIANGSISAPFISGSVGRLTIGGRAPLAAAIDSNVDDLDALTREVKEAIARLEI